MRLTVLLQQTKGVLAEAPKLGEEVAHELASIKHFLWHGNTGEFSPPSFEATMARKDVRLMIEEAQRHDVDLPVMRGVAAAYDEAIGRGDGALDSSAVARV